MKKCKSCAHPVSESSRFCTFCGAPIVGEITEEEKSSKKHFKKKTLIITAILAFIMIFSASAIILHKTPKELYLLSEYKTYKNAKEGWDDKFGDTMEFQERMKKEPSSSEVTLSGNVKMDSLTNDPDIEMVQELLTQASFTAKAEQDPISNQGYYKLALNVDKEKAMDVEMFQTKGRLGMKVPKLYEKFFYLNLNEYGEFLRMLNPSYAGPETLEVSDLEWQDLKLTEIEQEYIQKRYGAFMLDRLKEKNFKLKKGLDYKHEGETRKVRELTLKLSSSETKKLVNDFLDHLIKDVKLHSMIVTRVQKVSNTGTMTDEARSSDTKEIKRQLVDGLKHVKNEIKDNSFPKGFSSTLLIDKDEQVIDRKVTTAFGSNHNQVNVEMKSKNVPYGNNQAFKEFSVALAPEKDEESKLMFLVTNDVAYKKDTRIENLKAFLEFEEYGEHEEIKLSMISDIEGENGDKQKIKRNFNINFVSGHISDLPSSFKGTMKQTSDLNLKKDYSYEKVELKLGIEDVDSGMVTVKLDAKTKLKDKLEMADLKINSGEGVSLVNIPEDEMDEIQEEIGMNLMELAVKYGIVPKGVYQFDGYDEASYDGYYEIEDEDSKGKF
ncbi:hypothetical protein [Peribacillus sp. NPDC060253]|uniref:hypothetical protein n=1 Tax=Peribacillus sp. NPDC060253 TaxID=3347084 RepID=UPI00365C976B